MAYKYMNKINMHAYMTAHVTLENDLCTRPKKSVYKGHLLCTDVSAITLYKVHAHPSKSSDVISLKYTDIHGVF